MTQDIRFDFNVLLTLRILKDAETQEWIVESVIMEDVANGKGATMEEAIDNFCTDLKRTRPEIDILDHYLKYEAERKGE